MNKWRVTCSNETALVKMDVLGSEFDELLLTAKENIEKEMKESEVEAQKNGERKLLANTENELHPGFSIPFDNMDLRIKCREMTMTS